MANYINSVSIGQYRGIKSLVINNLNNVNIVVGDNNSGKTSLLEAIYLLRATHSFSNVIRTARLRNYSPFISISTYESFVNMFPKDDNNRSIYLQAEGSFGHRSIEILGEESVVLVEDEDLKKYPVSVRHTKSKTLLGSETPAFIGMMRSSVNSNRKEIPIRFAAVSRAEIYSGRAADSINVYYLSPVSHIVDSTFFNIVKNNSYKEICIQLIRLFDPDIDDLVYLRNDITGRAIEYIRSKKLGLMPLSTYGDGIKKVLSLANAIVEAAGGVLLIDEIDTSIHYRYYADIFSFLIKASLKYDVQLFITTHSEEAIDEILKTQKYDESVPAQYDPINVITFRKDNYGNVRSRSMSGFDVHTDRELFDFEVRL